MAVTISGTNGVTFPDNTSMQTGQQACKAWVHFDGTGAVSIRQAYNVSTITDNGLGDYTLNFAPGTFTNANYCVLGSGGGIAGAFNSSIGVARYLVLPTIAAVRVLSFWGTSLIDSAQANVAVFSN